MSLYGFTADQIARLRRVVDIVENKHGHQQLQRPPMFREPTVRLAIAKTTIAPGDFGVFDWVRSTSYATSETTQAALSALDWLDQGFEINDKAILIRPVPSARWYAFKPNSTGVDVKFKITASEASAGYWNEQIQNLAPTSAIESDINVLWYPTKDDTAAELFLRVTGWTTYERMFISRPVGSTSLEWATGVGGGGDDIFVKVNSTEPSAGYLADQIENPNPTSNVPGDLTVQHNTLDSNTGLSLMVKTTGYDQYQTQYLTHQATGTTTFEWTTLTVDDVYVKINSSEPNPGYLQYQIENSTDVGSAEGDLNVRHYTLPGNTGMEMFVKTSAYSSGIQQFLTHQAGSSTIEWATGTGAGGADEFFKINGSEITAGRWEDQVAGVQTVPGAAGDLDVNWYTSTSTGVSLYINVNSYDSASQQFLSHSSGTTTLTWTSAVAEDIYVAVNSSEPSAGYLQDQLEHSTNAPFADGSLKVNHYTLPTNTGIESFIRVNYYSGGQYQYLVHEAGDTDPSWSTGLDRYVQVNSGSTPGYLENAFVRSDTVPSGSGDLDVVRHTPTSTGIQLYVNVTGYNSGFQQFLTHQGGTTTLEWATGTGSGGADEFFKINGSEITAGRWEDQVAGVATLPSGSGDLDVKWYTATSTGVALYVDVASYNSGAVQYLSHAGGTTNLSWSTGDDKYVKVNSGSTSGYLENAFVLSDTVPAGSGDLQVVRHTPTSTGISLYVNVTGYDNSQQEFLSHQAGSTTLEWATGTGGGGTDELFKINVGESAAGRWDDQIANQITSGSTGGDLDVRWYTATSTGVAMFVRATGYDVSQQQFLTHAQSTTSLSWTTSADSDEKVKISSDDTAAGYLEDKLTLTGDTYQSGTNGFADQTLHYDVASTGSNENLRIYLDASALTAGPEAFTRNYVQSPAHTTGATTGLGWVDPGKTKVSSTDALDYLKDQFLPLDTVAGGAGDLDVVHYWDFTNGNLEEYINVYNYGTAAGQVLGHTSGQDTPRWLTFDHTTSSTAATGDLDVTFFIGNTTTINAAVELGYYDSTALQLVGHYNAATTGDWFKFYDEEVQGSYDQFFTKHWPVHIEMEATQRRLRMYVKANEFTNWVPDTNNSVQFLVNTPSSNVQWVTNSWAELIHNDSTYSSGTHAIDFNTANDVGNMTADATNDRITWDTAYSDAAFVIFQGSVSVTTQTAATTLDWVDVNIAIRGAGGLGLHQDQSVSCFRTNLKATETPFCLTALLDVSDTEVTCDAYCSTAFKIHSARLFAKVIGW